MNFSSAKLIHFSSILPYLPATLFSILGQAIAGYDPENSQLFTSILMLLHINTAINPILFIALSAKVGSSGRQIGQSSDDNTSKGRLNVTQ